MTFLISGYPWEFESANILVTFLLFFENLSYIELLVFEKFLVTYWMEVIIILNILLFKYIMF